MAKILLQKGADSNTKNIFNYTPLMFASYDKELVELLIAVSDLLYQED